MEKIALSGEISALRKVRDYSFDCKIGKETEEVLKWSSLAAKYGNEEDKEFHQKLLRVHRKSDLAK
ncbi:hypothetical protein GCM10027296_22850 [Chitinimonas naiadis]